MTDVDGRCECLFHTPERHKLYRSVSLLLSAADVSVIPESNTSESIAFTPRVGQTPIFEKLDDMLKTQLNVMMRNRNHKGEEEVLTLKEYCNKPVAF
ncbi:hypothetical protein UY3_07180 [Chelonia mydas]|uniref:Uncharacterized protein n=1 Tax=Chelonia mydas TaxID=8469 RepID=M7BU75_CHEMY|nr:hypothetical protein UY3_07180 [Chelonia mydas]